MSCLLNLSPSVCKLTSSKHCHFGDDDLTYKHGYRQWNKQNQRYEGSFLGGVIHGSGTYKWNKHAAYEGSFYSNMKQGYALISLANNCCFEGLFVNNKPFGPGVYTYSNGRQDVGYWVGRKLVRLSRAVDFIIPRLAATPSAKIKLLQSRRPIPLYENPSRSVSDLLNMCNCPLQPENASPYSKQSYDPRSFLFDRLTFDNAYFLNALYPKADSVSTSTPIDLSKSLSNRDEEEEEEESEPQIPEHCRCEKNVFEMVYEKTNEEDICCEEQGEHDDLGILGYYSQFGTLKEFFGSENDLLKADTILEEEEVEGEDGQAEEVITCSRNDLRVEMLKQIYRHRAFEGQVNFKIAKLMSCKRTAFRQTGEQERECLLFLKMCSLGPAFMIKSLLCDYEISQDLMDSRGNNSLMFAAACDQHDIIDILLDYGVDVNAFNDEGLTPLNLCLLRRLAEGYGITNWEKAFLPPEVKGTLDIFQTEEWRQGISIESLDRIFGDGMSLQDVCNPPPTEETSQCKQEALNPTEMSLDHLSSSEFTLENIKTLQGSITYIGSNSTPTILSCIVPKSLRREEYVKSVAKTENVKYMFDLTLRTLEVDQSVKSAKTKNSQKNDQKRSSVSNRLPEEDSREKETNQKEQMDSEVAKKLMVIDETIEKLLKRGADPNLSEVPKPPIHMAVFTKNIDLTTTLLSYGANPNQQLFSSEGLLTPLHVLALSKPGPEYVEICNLLLKHGANTEEETTPEFCIYEGETILDSEHGRTPLELLCMRPDMENGDPQGYLKKKALLLAKACDKSRLYNGHSPITLCMISANFDLLQTLLNSKYFDPNNLLGNNLGTSLHVLVSTEFQMKTVLSDSIKVCDMLIKAGADPTIEFKGPKKLQGTCVDFGRREIIAEMEAREMKKDKKKEAKTGTSEKSNKRDHLVDHVKVVEYLEGIITEKLSGRQGDLTSTTGRKQDGKSDRKDGKDKGRKSDQRGRSEGGGDSDEDGRSKSEKDKKGKGQKEGSEAGGKKGERDKGSRAEKDDGGSKRDQKGEKGRGGRGEDDDLKDGGGKRGKGRGDDEREGSDRKGRKGKNAKDKDGETAGKDSLQDKKGKKKNLQDEERRTKESDTRGKSQKDDESCSKEFKMSKIESNPSCRDGLTAEAFLANLRKLLLEAFGNPDGFDLNDLILPYIVLRDGNFYYRFSGKQPMKKEQYSLV